MQGRIESLLAAGIQYERGGVLEKAFRAYIDAEGAAVSPDRRAEAIRRQAEVLRKLGRNEESIAQARRSQQLARELDDGGRRLAEAINAEALVHLAAGDFETSAPLLREILAVTHSQEHRGIALQNLAYIAAHTHEWDEAAALLERSRVAYRASAFRRGEVLALNNLGALQLDRGKVDEAIAAFEEASRAALLEGDMELHGISSINHAEALTRLGRADDAMLLVITAMGYFQQVQDHLRLIECYLAVGEIEAAGGNSGGAKLAYGNARSIAQSSGIRTYDAKIAQKLADVEHPTPSDQTVQPDDGGMECDVV